MKGYRTLTTKLVTITVNTVVVYTDAVKEGEESGWDMDVKEEHECEEA